MNNLPQSLNDDWVVPYSIAECKQRIAELPERGFSKMHTITEFGEGDTYNQPFVLRRVSRNIPIKFLAFSSLDGNFAYQGSEVAQINYKTGVNWWYFAPVIAFFAFFLAFVDQFILPIIGVMIVFSSVQIAINIWFSQRFMKKQLKEALLGDM